MHDIKQAQPEHCVKGYSADNPAAILFQTIKVSHPLTRHLASYIRIDCIKNLVTPLPFIFPISHTL